MQHKKLIFLYDKLMTKEEQQKMRIDAEFIAFGFMHAKLNAVTVRLDKNQAYRKKIERLFAVPTNGTKIIFGGIFAINYENMSRKLHSYYHNSIPLLKKTQIEDLFDIVDVGITPIKFKSFEDLKLCNYDIGNEVICSVFIGNQNNPRIAYNTKRREYKRPSINDNFIKMIKDKQEVNYGLE